MKTIFSQTITRYFFIVGAGAFLFMSFLGLSHMFMDRKGEMMNCPFMNEAILCQMTPFQHLTAWQSMFTQVSIKEIFNPFALVLLSLLLANLFKSFWYKHKFPLLQNLNFEPIAVLIIPNLLEVAFSDGILNTKVY